MRLREHIGFAKLGEFKTRGTVVSDQKKPLPKRDTSGTSEAARAGREMKSSYVSQRERG